MQKEKLTMQNIKADLRSEFKTTVGGLVGRTLFFLGVLSVAIWVFSLDPINFYAFSFEFLSIIMLVVVLIQAKKTIELYKVFNDTECIVKDKLIGKEIKEYVTRYGIREEYYLYFSGYGEFKIAGEYYTWSSMFSMLHQQIYRSSDCGDEFYLVLTKRHTGKVLMAYNTKMFEME